MSKVDSSNVCIRKVKCDKLPDWCLVSAFMVWEILPDKIDEFANRTELAKATDPEANLIKYLECPRLIAVMSVSVKSNVINSLIGVL